MFLWVLWSSGLVPVKCIEGTEEWKGLALNHAGCLVLQGLSHVFPIYSSQ